MDWVEASIVVHLNNYKIHENKELYKLPEDKNIDFFIDTIKKLVDTIPNTNANAQQEDIII